MTIVQTRTDTDTDTDTHTQTHTQHKHRQPVGGLNFPVDERCLLLTSSVPDANRFVGRRTR